MTHFSFVIITLSCLCVSSFGDSPENQDYITSTATARSNPIESILNNISDPASEGIKAEKRKEQEKRKKSYYRKRVVKKGQDGNLITKEYFRFGHTGNKNLGVNTTGNGKAESENQNGTYTMILEAWTEMLNSGGHSKKEALQKFHYKLGFEAAVDDAKEAAKISHLNGTAMGRAAISVMATEHLETLKSAYKDGYEAAKLAVRDGIIDLRKLEQDEGYDKVAEYSEKSAKRDLVPADNYNEHSPKTSNSPVRSEYSRRNIVNDQENRQYRSSPFEWSYGIPNQSLLRKENADTLPPSSTDYSVPYEYLRRNENEDMPSPSLRGLSGLLYNPSIRYQNEDGRLLPLIQ